MAEVEFIFNTEITKGIEDIVKEARKKLLLVSPFIDLSPEIKRFLVEKKEDPTFQLQILFGKNSEQFYKSLKQDSFDFFKQFPNVDIRYEESLHAKFFMNDSHLILTSMNLYDYSLRRNIECGVRYHHTATGILGKAMDFAYDKIEDGVEKVKTEVLSMNKSKEQDPVVRMLSIYNEAKQVYKTTPVLEEKSRLASLVSKPKIKEIIVEVDLISNNQKRGREAALPKQFIEPSGDKNSLGIKMSLSKISKKVGKDPKELMDILERESFVKGGSITEKGKSQGLEMKAYMGKEYIAYPEGLDIFN